MNSKIIEGLKSFQNERLREIADLKREGKSTSSLEYRAKAYQTAISTLKDYPQIITSGEQVKHLRGIGPKISARIDEILKDTRAPIEEPKELELFGQIHQVGPVTARKWYDLGYRSLKDVPQEICTRAQWLSIQFFEETKQRIPREEIDSYNQRLHANLDPMGIEFQICGSYRRGRPDSGDIDILVKYKQIDNGMSFMDTLAQAVEIKFVLSSGPKKLLGIGQPRSLHRRIDIEVCQPQEYPFALLYFTGSANFNKRIREHCLERNWKLNEKSLVKGSLASLCQAKDEKEVFELLEMDYMTPEQRDW